VLDKPSLVAKSKNKKRKVTNCCSAFFPPQLKYNNFYRNQEFWVKAKYFPTKISLRIEVATQFCHGDQQKAVWFEGLVIVTFHGPFVCCQ